MDPLMIGLRLAHFIAGAAWVGGAVYFNLLLVPALRSLDDETSGAVTRRARAAMGPVFGILAIVTIASGGAMIALLRADDPASLTAGWWTSMAIGIVTALLTLAIAFGPEMRALRAVDRLRASIAAAGSARTGPELRRLGGRAATFGRLATASALISLATMAFARFV
jgi:hypothetical protein